MNDKPNYKDTLNLPKTTFSMKADLPRREPETLRKWDGMKVYEKILALRRPSGKTYILHDGPPYANGHIHMGHVLNKILKDISVKYAALKGNYAPYVPGWDCHGLPVEHQLFKELNMTKNDISQVEFRKKAYKYAMKFVKIQAEEFKRLGVFGNWDDPYLTLSRAYEANILYALADLYEKGFIYKGLKPVNWCKTCETALAEAEVEYEDKVSPSIYVKFPAKNLYRGKNLVFIVWTTTPWTLLGNVAVALNPGFEYSFVEVGAEVWVMLSELVEPLMKRFSAGNYSLLEKMSGERVIKDIQAVRHPFIERDSVLVPAAYVTKEEGTGSVHTAPGHGADDHITGKKFSLPVIMPVDERGRFKKGTGEFEGEDVFKANKAIIEKMAGNGSLVLADKITHAYPHCWRCKDPIIYRATEQWFMKIDHDGLREKMVHAINNEVKWVPGGGVDRIGAMISGRPDWCLSRQRYWGVPIPAVKCRSCGKAFTTAQIIRNTAKLTEKDGADAWFEKAIDQIVPAGTKCPECAKDDLVREQDILDVWFDSGVSFRAVLQARPELSFPADLYLEGSDQHRGWFQAAIITSMGINGVPPYRKVLTHGFVVDGEGKKMSKSLGNVIQPEEIMKKYGADVLRLWVSSSDYSGDIKLSDEILARLADGYRKIRNTLKYLISNLYDYDHARDCVPPGELHEVDRWMLSRLYRLVKDNDGYYANFEFYKVYRSVYDFCVTDISSFYLDIQKDIMYVVSPGSSQRRSGQTVIFHLLDVITRILSPILAFTMDEVWEYVKCDGKEESVHMSLWPGLSNDISGWNDEPLMIKWDGLIALRNEVMKSLEEKRATGLIGSSLDARIELYSEDAKESDFLSGSRDLMAFIFRVSQVEIVACPAVDMEKVGGRLLLISVRKARGCKCPRCWNYAEIVGVNSKYPELCQRCGNVMDERRNSDGQ
ncbi:MAG: isoleucine--tRNA ligase [Candidatus Omnitrophica bacterium]|nr:isoleucine--tRNA ligase [Candidatus Omnitrophota bacterium]